MMIEELKFTTDITLKKKASELKKEMKQLAEEVTGDKNAEAILVGYEFHFLIRDTMTSVSAWAKGFNKEDYEK